MKPKTIPDGYHSITPYLKLPNCTQLLEFLKKAFGAIEKGRLVKPDGSLLHAEVLIGDSMVMVHEAPPPWKAKPSTMYLRVDDADATYKQAVAAGATTVFEPANTYYGARVACITDVSRGARKPAINGRSKPASIVTLRIHHPFSSMQLSVELSAAHQDA